MPARKARREAGVWHEPSASVLVSSRGVLVERRTVPKDQPNGPVPNVRLAITPSPRSRTRIATPRV
jgi:hypothetical protein